MTTYQQEDKWKSESFILKVVLNTCISSAVSGYFLAYFNTISFRDTQHIFNIQHDPALMQGLLTFCIPLGSALGGCLSNILTNHYSRMECNLIIAYMALAATIFLQSGNIFILMICRLLQGVYMGVASVVRPVYIK